MESWGLIYWMWSGRIGLELPQSNSGKLKNGRDRVPRRRRTRLLAQFLPVGLRYQWSMASPSPSKTQTRTETCGPLGGRRSVPLSPFSVIPLDSCRARRQWLSPRFRKRLGLREAPQPSLLLARGRWTRAAHQSLIPAPTMWAPWDLVSSFTAARENIRGGAAVDPRTASWVSCERPSS
jgi:hypothetical protein